jgi:S-formylglutathione hydrolase FrmB
VDKNSSIFITGLSMGGYGAMRLGAKYPEVFKAFSGLSSVTTFQEMAQFLENNDLEKLSQSVKKPENTLEIIIQNKATLPPFRFDCGVDDILIEANRNLHNQLIINNIPHFYEELKGKHEWNYWEENIVKTLLFFDGLK